MSETRIGAIAPATRSRPGAGAAAHVFTLAALLAWWAYSKVVPDYQLPGPWPVLKRIGSFLTNPIELAQLGLSLAHVAAAMRLTLFLNAFSGIGWLFLAILWFGLNDVTVIFAVTLILLPFTVINVGAGLQELDRDLIELGRSLSRSPLRRIAKIVVPLLLPYLFAALRTSFGVSWKVVLTAELFGGNGGVGYLLNVARQEFDTETIFAIIFLILIFVAAAEVVFFRPIQRRLDRRFARA